MLCYHARPNGSDPDSCIFEVYVLERFPEGEEPKTEWVSRQIHQREMAPHPRADFGNMAAVQKGIKSRGFMGARPNPIEEETVVHFYRMLEDTWAPARPNRSVDAFWHRG